MSCFGFFFLTSVKFYLKVTSSNYELGFIVFKHEECNTVDWFGMCFYFVSMTCTKSKLV